MKGVIVECLAQLSYLIEMENHQYWKCHTDQLKVIEVSPQQVQPLLELTEFQEEPSLEYVDPPITEISNNPVASPPDLEAESPSLPAEAIPAETNTTSRLQPTACPMAPKPLGRKKYSVRNRKPPDYFQPSSNH